MLTINTNLSSLIAQSSMKQSTAKLNQAIERMTTGFKINHAKDNAANYSIATNMTTKINSYMVAEDNAAMGLDLISTAEGTLNQIQDKLERLRALQEQASNGTYGEESLNAINAEVNALVDEINRTYSTAEYNGLRLFGGNTVNVSSIALVDGSDPIQTFAISRANETISSVGFIEPIEYEDASSTIAVSTLDEDAELDPYATYSVESAEDLVKLSTMTLPWGNLSLILVEDIDMSSVTNWEGLDVSPAAGYCIYGNGHVISNLQGTSGLIRSASSGLSIYNLGLENVEINSSGNAGAFANFVGCQTTIKNCYITGSVSGTDNVGSLVGKNLEDFSVESVSCDVIVSGGINQGGLVGYVDDDDDRARVDITNSQYLGKSESLTGIFVGNTQVRSSLTANFQDSIYNEYYDILGIPMLNGAGTVNVSNVTPVKVAIPGGSSSGGDAGTGSGDSGIGGVPPTPPLPNLPIYQPDMIMLQVGTSSNWGSQVGLSTNFVLNNVDDLRMIGLDKTTDYLEIIDDMLELVSEKQTHFGAVSNRLESVLEEIVISRDNLISSRSTIRDADIAEVSSHYIQQQILQQASATLLATANQSPSISLQLI